ncbi:MAG: DUF1566 domain-containing protein [Nitrospirae bacterium]|nr:DUF1566 domain-containing protein [Nitrospirota bacterium]
MDLIVFLNGKCQQPYDSDLGITWYDFRNAANTWQNQVNWASGLSVNFGGTVYDDWRLPTTFQPDPNCAEHAPFPPYEGYGYNCSSSEMGHLFYTELLNTPGGPPVKTGDFQALQANAPSQGFWSGTEYIPGGNYGWVFYFNSGGQAGSAKSSNYYGLAVREGNVVAAPEPISSILFFTGGTLLAGRRFLRKKKKA